MNRFLSYISVILFLFIYSCAQQGAPSGGPKDEDPPLLLKAEPENYSVNFSSKKIMLTFDEYLDMGNFTQQLVVSPPMDEQPQIKLRNKTLIIEFEEELKKDITYTFNFGEGIKDLNEKNVLLNFEYVFSTGDFLDSLSVKGTLKNAIDLTIPEIPISVMLYTELNDSLPLTNIPYYVGRTDKEGNFSVNNLQSNVYKLFVLKDANNNFLFDNPDEPIAFLDSSLLVDPAYFKNFLLSSGRYDSADFVLDTLPLAIDTTGMSADTIAMVLDSLEQLKPDLNSIFVDLYMFVEEPTNQFISEYKREKRNLITLLFNIPLTDSFRFDPLYPDSLTIENFIPVYGKNRDTLNIWLGDTLVAGFDTIDLKLTYTVLDTLNQPVLKSDTLFFVYKEPVAKGNTRNNQEEKEEVKKDPLKLSMIRNGGKQNLHHRYNIAIDQPMGEIDVDKFEFFIIPDTTEIKVNAVPLRDPGSLFKAGISTEWKENTKYRMVFYPGAIKDIYGTTHDTIDMNFTTKSLADYGKILLTLDNVQDSIVIELYQKEKLVRKKSISSSGTYIFEYLDPSTYRVKLLHDRNLNGKWDTGKYLGDRQPEKVEFLPKDISVRANWDHDASYTMGSFNSFPSSEKKQEESGDSPNRDSNFRPGNNVPGNNVPGNNMPNRAGSSTKPGRPNTTLRER